MRHLGKFALVLLICVSMPACAAESKTEQKAEKRVDLKTDKDKLSYAFGMEIGQALKSLKTDIDMKVFAEAVQDVYTDKSTLLDTKAAAQVKRDYFSKMEAQAMKEFKEDSEKNKKAGDEFRAANAKKEGVTVTKSGLQFQVLKQGDGKSPTLEDQVKVQYAGMTIDGKEFDSSYKRGEPATFPVAAVIPGWTEALQLMKVGGKYRVVTPPDLAYGEIGAGRVIGPNATLVFEVELLGVEKATQKTPNADTTGASDASEMK